MAEKGVLPADSHNFVKKLERYFNVRLLTNSVALEKPESEITFNPILDDDLTISDLQEGTKERVPYWKRKFGFLIKKKSDTDSSQRDSDSSKDSPNGSEMSDEELKQRVKDDLSKEMDDILGKSR